MAIVLVSSSIGMFIRFEYSYFDTSYDCLQYPPVDIPLSPSLLATGMSVCRQHLNLQCRSKIVWFSCPSPGMFYSHICTEFPAWLRHPVRLSTSAAWGIYNMRFSFCDEEFGRPRPRRTTGRHNYTP